MAAAEVEVSTNGTHTEKSPVKGDEAVEITKTEEISKTDEISKTEEISDELKKKIVTQVEYYFGDYNLPRDKFLKEEIKNDEGWISMETMLKFKRLSTLSESAEVITAALKSLSSDLMEVNEDGKKIRRITTRPLPLFNDDIKIETHKRTVYCKGFPKDNSCALDNLLEFFKQYGPYETVHMRYYFDKANKKQGFKGSALVVFPDEIKSSEFMDLGEVKYNGTVLIRKFYETYIEEKKAEIEERRANKEARQKEKAAEGGENKVESLAEGHFLHMTGLSDGISREDLKGIISKTTEDLAFIDYSKGDSEGYLRFKKPGTNKDILEKLGGKITVKEVEIPLRIVDGEEEKTQIEKANLARSRAMSNMGQKRKFGGNRGGRRGGRGGNKRSRH